VASAGRDQLIPDGVNVFVMETAGSSCQCIQASSEFLPKVDTSDQWRRQKFFSGGAKPLPFPSPLPLTSPPFLSLP